MTISLCLIVKNEEKTLGRCLESFSSLVDEMIVVDTGSEDQTKKIAEKAGAKVFDFQWIDDFSAARNDALRHASQEWIMTVDADDVMEKATIEDLAQKIASLPANIDLISLPYVYQRSGKNNNNAAYLPRLWKRSLNLKWVQPIHEYLEVSSLPESRMETFDLPIIHLKDSSDYKSSFKRNVAILEKHIQKNPGDIRTLYYLVHDNEMLGDHQAVIQWAQQYLQAQDQDSVYFCRTLVRKGRAHRHLGQLAQAQESFLLAQGANALLIEPYLALGELYRKEKRYEESVHMYECAMLCKHPKRSHVFYNQSMYLYYPFRGLAYTLPFLNRYEEAIAYTEKALSFCPDSKKLQEHLSTLKKTRNS